MLLGRGAGPTDPAALCLDLPLELEALQFLRGDPLRPVALALPLRVPGRRDGVARLTIVQLSKTLLLVALQHPALPILARCLRRLSRTIALLLHFQPELGLVLLALLQLAMGVVRRGGAHGAQCKRGNEGREADQFSLLIRDVPVDPASKFVNINSDRGR